MKKLLKYMKGYRTQCILGPIFKALEAVFELCIPLVVKSIIDIGIGNADKAYIVKMCGLMVLLGVVGLSSTLVAQYFAARAACGFSARLRGALFEHTASLSYSELDSIGSSTLITRMTSDVNQVQNGVNMFLRLFSRSPFIVFGSMIMAFTIDVKAALVFAVAIAILSVVVFSIMAMTVPLHKKVQKYRRASVEDNARAQQSAREHRAIFEAIAAHNAPLAEKYMMEHIANAKDFIQKKGNH